MSVPVYLPNNLNDTIMTGNLDLYGNVNVNSQNVYLGYLAGNTNPGGGTLVNNMKNVAIGSSCATYQTGSNNVSIGYDAATNSTITYNRANNVSIGYNSGFNSSGASNGVAIGVNSLIDFSGSIAIGSASTATGFRNIAIGASAFSTGNTYSIGNSIAIGVGASTLWYGNSVAIGFGATSTANNQITIGTTDNKLAFFGIARNYIFAFASNLLDLNNNSNNNPNNSTSITFDTLVNTNTSLFNYDSSGAFVNVSGRSLVCFISFNICINNTAVPDYSKCYVLITNSSDGTSSKYGSCLCYSPKNTNTGARLCSSFVVILNANDYFVCKAGSFGGSNNTATSSNSANNNPNLTIVCF
jgi:hypothetical protein